MRKISFNKAVTACYGNFCLLVLRPLTRSDHSQIDVRKFERTKALLMRKLLEVEDDYRQLERRVAEGELTQEQLPQRGISQQQLVIWYLEQLITR